MTQKKRKDCKMELSQKISLAWSVLHICAEHGGNLVAELPDRHTHIHSLNRHRQTRSLQRGPTPGQLGSTALTTQIDYFLYCTSSFYDMRSEGSSAINTECIFMYI